MKTKTNQSGRSMIEMLGVLAIIGVLSVGGIAGYSKAMSKYRANKTIEQITMIANGVRTLYSGQKNYDNISSHVLRKAKILPESAFEGSVTGPYATNPYSSKIGVFPSNKDVDGDNRAFLVALYGIPEDACIEILTQDWGDSTGLISYGTDFTTASGAASNCTSSPNHQCGKDGPMSVTKAMNICHSVTDTSVYDSGIGIAFKFF